MIKESLIQYFGDSPIDYLSLDPRLEHFENQDTFLAFSNQSVIGNPIGKNKIQLLDAFISSYPHHCFYHISEEIAEYLQKKDYFISFMGYEHSLELQEITISWKNFNSLKSGANKCLKRKISIKEKCLSELKKKELEYIGKKWLERKETKKAVGLLIRKLDFISRKGFRYFFAYQEKKLIGYYFFAPIYKDKKLVAYYTDNCRYIPELGKNLSDLFIYHAVKVFKKEGRERLSLGLSPFAENYHSNFPQNRTINTLFKLIYHLNIPKYGYKGIHRYSQKFHSQKAPYFFASKKRLDILNLFQTWKKMNT
tara:strand:+ start:217 stop:1143 length:927 start_codon:yes stop_codon:yes gene_type:complete